MALLVQDASAFMLPEERGMEPDEGIRVYCQRLARIYKREESIGGLSINVELFDTLSAERHIQNHHQNKPQGK